MEDKELKRLTQKTVDSIRSQLAGFDELTGNADDDAKRQEIKRKRVYEIQRDRLAYLADQRKDAISKLPSIEAALTAKASKWSSVNALEFIALADAVANPSEPVKPPHVKAALVQPIVVPTNDENDEKQMPEEGQ